MGRPLTKSQQDEVVQLKKTDAAVRRHEQAHLSAAGRYARSGIQLNFKTGPDGKQYAVGGDVKIDTSAVSGDPAATIEKMDTVVRAALAPADPSAQDHTVAAEATQKADQARAQEMEQKTSSSQASSGSPASSTGSSLSAGSSTQSGGSAIASAALANRFGSRKSTGQLLNLVA